LYSTAPNSFSALTGLATLYGVVFAIIEVARLNSAASAQARAVSLATKKIEALSSMRDLLSCREKINIALEALEESNFVSHAVLARVVELYVAEYAKDVRDPVSQHRENVSHVRAYTMASKPGNHAATGRLKGALFSMLEQVCTDAADRTGEVTQ
jgi:hypothetical protein